MSTASATLPASGSVVTVHEVADCVRVLEPDVTIVRLVRALDPAVHDDARAWVADRCAGLTGTFASDVSGLEALVQRFELARALGHDVARWAEVLADLLGAERLGVRVARTTRAMCPRMHVDFVPIRLVTTYVGAGTELLASEHADRRRLGHAAGGEPDETSGLLRPGATVLRAGPGEVLLLKGDAWPGHEGRGAIHRSPRASEDEPRLVVTIDPM